MGYPETVGAGPAAVFTGISRKVGVLAGIICAAIVKFAGRAGLADTITSVRAHGSRPAT